jgi:hypothetical protein
MTIDAARTIEGVVLTIKPWTEGGEEDEDE